MKSKISVLLPLIMAVVLAMGIEIGLLLNGAKQSALFSGGSSTVDEVLDYVRSKYVDTVNIPRLESTAISGMLEQLDPHSTYIPPAALKEVNEEMEGNFDGIGIEFFIVNDTVMVVSVIGGGPAEAVGLLAGDKIITIGDSMFAGTHITNEEVVKRLRGTKGSKVTVGILRRGSAQLLPFTITRGTIPMASIDAAYMVDAQTGYIKINRFAENTAPEFVHALDTLKSRGMTRLIIDLRQNGGGLLEAATDIIDELLDQQKIMVYTKGRVFSRMDYKTKVLGDFEQGPLAILIDEGSASASEIVAGAMQDWDRAVIVGRRSFGKGLVQEQYGLSDGAALRLTVAKYYTPSGRCIQKPYDKNLNDYYDEVVNRFHNGEVLSADSIHNNDTTRYFTSEGRVVYGGGGIVPDVFVPLDTSNNNNHFLNRVLNAGMIQQFSYSYFQSHRGLLSQYATALDFRKRFTAGNDLYNAFLAYSMQHQVDGSPAEKTSAAQYISTRIKAYFAREKFSQDAFYAVINDSDPVLAHAMQEMGKNLASLDNHPAN